MTSEMPGALVQVEAIGEDVPYVADAALRGIWQFSLAQFRGLEQRLSHP